MKTRTRADVPKKIESGDYGSTIKQKGGKMAVKRQKQLINLPDEQKTWVLQVVQLATERGQDCNQTVVIRSLVGNAMREAPEQFVERLEKLQLAARLADIDRRAAALEAEKAQIAKKLSGNRQAVPVGDGE